MSPYLYKFLVVGAPAFYILLASVYWSSFIASPGICDNSSEPFLRRSRALNHESNLSKLGLDPPAAIYFTTSFKNFKLSRLSNNLSELYYLSNFATITFNYRSFIEWREWVYDKAGFDLIVTDF